MSRLRISKALRFTVFKRDGFRCVYCGDSPPDCRLHVDHKMPVSKGGTNEVRNLVTACQSCNLGKAARFAFTPEEVRRLEEIEEQSVDSEHLMFDGDPYLRAIYGELVV